MQHLQKTRGWVPLLSLAAVAHQTGHLSHALLQLSTVDYQPPLRRFPRVTDHESRTTPRFLPSLLTSLPPYFITSRNGDALPAAMGLLRKGRAVFRREDRSMENSIAGRRWRSVRHSVEFMHVHSVAADRHRVIRRHGEERSRRFLSLNIRQRVARLAKA